MANRKHKLAAYYKAMTTGELQALMDRISDKTNQGFRYKNGKLLRSAHRLYDAVLDEVSARNETMSP